MAEGEGWGLAYHTQNPWPPHSPAHPGSQVVLGGPGLHLHSHPERGTDGKRPCSLYPDASLYLRTGTPRGQVSYLFSFFSRGAN